MGSHPAYTRLHACTPTRTHPYVLPYICKTLNKLRVVHTHTMHSKVNTLGSPCNLSTSACMCLCVCPPYDTIHTNNHVSCHHVVRFVVSYAGYTLTPFCTAKYRAVQADNSYVIDATIPRTLVYTPPRASPLK
jgi:hypothetical protein